MISFSISNEIKYKLPEYTACIIHAHVQNSVTKELLLQEIQNEVEKAKKGFSLNNIKTLPSIAATREAYKILGKDPNRYRPSAEALLRRIVNGADLYKISTLVDLINLVSISTGFSIGGFDAEKICGNVVVGIGKENELFSAIGRGLLNIANLPVLRDEKGGIGTPTSDEERTSLSFNSSEIFVVINSYSKFTPTDRARDFAIELMQKYASAREISSKIVG